MRNRSFGDFVDKKKRDTISQLGVIEKMLEESGLKVESHLETEDSDEPYIFCKNPVGGGGFDGIRIYKIGDHLAFRVQKESKTHPYGAAYPLPIEDMFHDFMTDDGVNEQEASKKIIEAVGKEIRRFFEKSREAERTERDRTITKDSAGDVAVKTMGTDYSASIHSKA